MMQTRKMQVERQEDHAPKRSGQNTQSESVVGSDALDMVALPGAVTPGNVLQLQRLYGNNVVRRMLATQKGTAQREPDNADAGAPIAGAPLPPAPTTDAGPEAAKASDASAAGAAAGTAVADDATKEADFATRGTDLIGKLGPDAAAPTGGGGDSAGAPIAGYPDWFNTIQHRLNFGASWGYTEEAAQILLHDYAVWRAAKDNGGTLPPSLEIFFRYIGRSALNKAANQKYAGAPEQTYDGDIPNAGELGAGQGYNWCAAATSTVFVKALADKGLKPIGSRTLTQEWFNANKLQVSGAAAATAELKPGDQISIVSKETPPSGHVATVVSVSGDEIMIVSGNSTNAKGGGTALEKIRRQTPPADFRWQLTTFDSVYRDAAKTTDLRKSNGYNGPLVPPPGSDYVWIVTIVRLSKEQPANIDPNNDEQLKQLGLERIAKK